MSEPGCRECQRKILLETMGATRGETINRRSEENAEFAETLHRAENELIDDFLDGKLTTADELLFRSRFLKSDDWLIKSLKRIGDRHQLNLSEK